MEMAQIRFFVAAAEIGSFRGAAENLNVRQSSVSRSVRRLEDRLGVSLFERSHGGVRLTNAGRRFLCDIQPAIEQLRLAEKMAAAAGRAEIGVVRVGVSTSLTGGFLRRLVHVYGRQFPNVMIDICDGGPDDHIASVRNRQLDIAFVIDVEGASGCEVVELWRERVHVALPQDHRLARQEQLDWPDLKGEQFIVSKFAPGPMVHDHLVRRTVDCGLRLNVAFKAVLQETLLNLVGLGHGLTIVCDAWATMALPDIVFRPLTDAEDIVRFSAVWSPHNDNPALRRLISAAHIMAGHLRRGSSDWAVNESVLTQRVDGSSVDAKNHDPSP